MYFNISLVDTLFIAMTFTIVVLSIVSIIKNKNDKK